MDKLAQISKMWPTITGLYSINIYLAEYYKLSPKIRSLKKVTPVKFGSILHNFRL